MDTFEKKINSNERLPNVETTKEIAKEKEITPEAKAAAMMERADVLVKEVKSSKQQIQNIMMNITSVLQAIQALRQQLQLVVNQDDNISSVEQDKKMIDKLKKKIAGHTDEILKMKEDLIIAQAKQLSAVGGVEVTEDLKNKARAMVENLLAQISSWYIYAKPVKIQKKQKEAESYYNKKIADADNILNNARLEQQKIEEHIKQKKQDAKNAGDSYLNNVKFQVDLQKNKLLEEATRTAKEMVENAKTKSNKLMEEVNNSYQERMKKIEMDTAAKMAFEEEESQKRIEQFRKQEEALKAQRVKEVYRNIKDVIIGRLNSNVGKPLSSGITNLIQEDLQNIIKLAFGYQMNERESIRGILFSGNLSKKVKMYWLKVGLSIFIPIFLLSIHLMAPNFFPAIGKHVVSFLTTEESASDIFIKQMLEARKNKPKYLPPLSAHYKPTYTDNILFTEAFIDTVTSPVFQKEWVIELNKFIVNDVNIRGDKFGVMVFV